MLYTMERFFQVPNEIFEAKLSIYHKMVLVYLYRAGNNDKPIFPSYATIAAKCSMSKTKAINTVKELENIGILTIKRRRKNERQNNSNLYYINRQAICANAEHSKSKHKTDPGTQGILPDTQDISPGTCERQGVVNGVYPINNQPINNQYKETDINKNSIGSAAAAEPCVRSDNTLSFDEYKKRFGDSKDPEIIKAMQYFIDCKESAHCEHKRMTADSWNKAADEILKADLFPDCESIKPLYCEWDRFTALVDRYFKKLGQFAPGCDYSLPHFNSPALKAILYRETLKE